MCVCICMCCLCICVYYVLSRAYKKWNPPAKSAFSAPTHSPPFLSLFCSVSAAVGVQRFFTYSFSTIFSSLLMLLLLLLISVFVAAVVIVVVAFVVNETFYLCALFVVALIPSLCHATHSRTHTASHTPSHSLTYSPIHSLTHSLSHSFTYSLLPLSQGRINFVSLLFGFFSSLFTCCFSFYNFSARHNYYAYISIFLARTGRVSPPLSLFLSLPCRALAIKILYLHISLEFSVIPIRISHLVFANPLWLSSFPPHTHKLFLKFRNFLKSLYIF